MPNRRVGELILREWHRRFGAHSSPQAQAPAAAGGPSRLVGHRSPAVSVRKLTERLLKSFDDRLDIVGEESSINGSAHRDTSQSEDGYTAGGGGA